MRTNFRLLSLIFLFAAIAFSAGAAETMGLYQVKPGDDYSTYFDTVAWSYTRPNFFNVQIFFGKGDIKEDDRPGKGNNQFFFELTRQQYEKIFESDKTYRNIKINDNIWNRNVSASTVNGKRVIKTSFTNSLDDEITEVFKRGRLEIIIGEDKIHSLKLFVERKRLLGMFGYKDLFLGEATNLKKVANGLALRDEGEAGRLKSAHLIDMALKDKSAKNFYKVLKLQK